MPTKITQRQTAFDLIIANGGAISTDVDNNPGTTADETAARLTLGLPLVNAVMAIMVELKMVVSRPQPTGADLYWASGDWATLLRTNFSGARTWIDNNDGGTVEDMAVALGIHFEVALALAQWFGGTGGRYIQLTRVP